MALQGTTSDGARLKALQLVSMVTPGHPSLRGQAFCWRVGDSARQARETSVWGEIPPYRPAGDAGGALTSTIGVISIPAPTVPRAAWELRP